MLPSVEDWLSDSWSDYKRRFWPLAAVLALTSLAAAAGALLPLAPAALAHWLGAASPWLIWGAAFAVSSVAALWLSTWGQAAAMIAASSDRGAMPAMAEGWRRTAAFAWTLSLVLLAACGGLVLFLVPGLVLAALLFFAPFYELEGEETGLAALELSWARVMPRLGAVFGRLVLLAAILWTPSWIPWIGWLLTPLFAPFGIVAAARLAADLRALSPAPERPRLAGPVAALAALLLLAGGAASWGSYLAGQALAKRWASGSLSLAAPDPATAQSLIAVLRGEGTEEDMRRSTAYALSLSSAAARGGP
ncbi:MAG: hypothetical protein M0D55_05925 [Elusimicrobiota bacterium]|nr:MAG: hypothetical protein M0D55_05925 [Elusimicrobiota bacterium]